MWLRLQRLFLMTTSTYFQYPVDLNGCGGSLVAPNVVLTAAHCDPSGNGLVGENALVGAYERQDDKNNGEFISIQAQAIHPNYDDGTVDNDFMLLRLSKSSPNTPVPINSNGNNPDTNSGGDTLTVIGVGATSQGGNSANTLQEVDVVSVSQSQCLSAYSPLYGPNAITDNMFCAGVPQGGKDSCQGDSGGPIFDSSGAQVGVVSWGEGCALAGFPGVYARVSEASNWIENVVCNQWGLATAQICGGNGGGDDGDNNNGGGGGGGDQSCSKNQIDFDFAFTTDTYGYETKWEVQDAGGKVVARGENYGNDQSYREQTCLADGCYTLTIYDEYGDG